MTNRCYNIRMIPAFCLCLLQISCSIFLDSELGYELSWCGDALCEWEVTTGEIQRAPTWHERDYGVELVGDTAEITYTDSTVDSVCIEFELIAYMEYRGQLSLGLDFWNDGTVDYWESIPRSNWERQKLLLPAPSGYKGIRIVIRKEKEGRVVLGQFNAYTSYDAQKSKECQQLDFPAPNGYMCEGDEDCLSGACGNSLTNASNESLWGRTYACGECTRDNDCSDGEICVLRNTNILEGLDPPRAQELSSQALFPLCVEPGSGDLGQVCLDDNECKSGICAGQPSALGTGYCSECKDDAGCESGATCSLGKLGVDEPTYARCVF